MPESAELPTEALSPQQCAELAGLGTPQSCQPIDAGLSHDSYQLQMACGRRYFIRLYRWQRKPWLNRQHELTMLAHASELGITPKLIYADPELRFFISHFVDNDPSATLSLEQLIELVQRINQLPVSFSMGLTDRLNLYVQQAEQLFAFSPRPQSQPPRGEWQQVVSLGQSAISVLRQQQWPQVPSFLDWHRGNVLIDNQRAYLVDFEYLVLSELPLELASLKLSELYPMHDWSKLKAFVESLYGIQVSEQMLASAEQLYWLMCYCWYWAVAPETAAEPTRKVARQLGLR